ncbi:endonuclease domain-containing protein [Mumia quercus]|uniref:endonuclease domain-containing protein n=1 Tax=Mumia quercus TaxID=2976125 RepID=UPI0021CF4C4C|nr:endonuclease domain-containing protein [Mumia quercus]
MARVGGTTSRTRNGIVRHRDALRASDVVDVEGIPTVRPPLAVAQAATTSEIDTGAVLVSSWISQLMSDARRRGCLEWFSQDDAKAELREVLASLGSRPGSRTAADAVTIADGRCESPAEVRVLVLCWRFSLPRPETQYELALPEGRRAEVDFLWPEQRLVVEFDGRVKYDGSGEQTGASVWAEKTRELKIRDLGYHVLRLTWADLAPENAERTAARLRRELVRAQRLYGHLSDGSSRTS